MPGVVPVRGYIEQTDRDGWKTLALPGLAAKMISNVLKSSLVALAVSSPAYAWWRVSCTTPLVSGAHF